MTYTITFNELRKIKDMLPHGSMQRITKTWVSIADTACLNCPEPIIMTTGIERRNTC